MRCECPAGHDEAPADQAAHAVRHDIHFLRIRVCRLNQLHVLCQHPACFSVRGRHVVIVVRLVGFQQRHRGAFLYRFNCLVLV